MGDHGLKITKEGVDIESQNPDDYIFWSKYKPLMLIGKVDTDILSPAGQIGGSVEQVIDFDFFPLVMAFKTNDFSFSGDLLIPWSRDGYAGRFSRYPDNQNSAEGITAKIQKGKIIYDWYAYGYDPQVGNQVPPDSDYTWNVTAYIYNLELGRELPD